MRHFRFLHIKTYPSYEFTLQLSQSARIISVKQSQSGKLVFLYIIETDCDNVLKPPPRRFMYAVLGKTFQIPDNCYSTVIATFNKRVIIEIHTREGEE